MNNWRTVLPWLQNIDQDRRMSFDAREAPELDAWDTESMISAWYTGTWSGDPLHED